MNTPQQNNKKSAGINVGSASLVMVFAVLALTVFAVLSLVTANNELKLANKFCASIENYYSADYIACDILEDIKMSMENNTAIDIESVTFQDTIGYFQVPIDEGQSLSVKIDIEDNDIEILSWQIINTIEQNYDTNLNVWSGE